MIGFLQDVRYALRQMRKCGALLAGRWIRNFLYGVTTADPLTFGIVGILVGLATTVAVLVPARRAASVDPRVALRYE